MWNERAYQEQWLEHDKAVVVMHGQAHRLQVRRYDAIYPYAHTVLEVSADCLDKNTAYYQGMKTQLGDDWVTDVLHGSEELTASVMAQLGWHCQEEE